MKKYKHAIGLGITSLTAVVISILLIIWRTEVTRRNDVMGADLLADFASLTIVFGVFFNYYLFRLGLTSGKWFTKILRIVASFVFLVIGGFLFLNIIIGFVFFAFKIKVVANFFASLSDTSFYILGIWLDVLISTLLLPLLPAITSRILYPIQIWKTWFYCMIPVAISVITYSFIPKSWWLILLLATTTIGFIIGRLIDKKEQGKIITNTNASY
jgi:hypothetical protein